MVSSESRHASNVIWAKQVIFRNLKYIYACNNNEEETMNLKEVGRDIYEGLEGERRRNMMGKLQSTK